MADNAADLVLDGNAAAGRLQAVFASDVTKAEIQCEACGSIRPVGSIRLYAAPMGAVLRCAHCDNILMRAVHTPHGLWLEMSGARYLKFRI
jgi:Family of unknown function (DUF6510)